LGDFTISEGHGYPLVPHNKDNLHKKQIEENIVLFIVKEVVPLSFVKTLSFLKD
jgi:hypothetical protein